MLLSRSTGVSFRTRMTETVPRRQLSTPVTSQRGARLNRRVVRRRDSTEDSWMAKSRKAGGGRDWHLQEDGLPRIADIQSRRSGIQLQSLSWSSRAGTERQHFSHDWQWVKSQSRRRRGSDETQGAVVRALAEQGLRWNRHPEDREGLPVDYRFLQLLLTAAEDPEVSLGDFAQGVRVGPGARLPRQPALYPDKKKWSLKQQYDGGDYLTTVDDEDATWRKNYSSLEPRKEKVLEVMEDQTSRGQVLKLTETEARFHWRDRERQARRSRHRPVSV